MNAQISLSFRNVNFDITDIHGQPWLRGYQIGNALEYSDGAVAIAKLYDRNADEFTDSMTQVIELPTAGGKQQVRVFSLRGCHLLGMLARTKVAKEFRRWVLDIIEQHRHEAGILTTEYHQALASLALAQETASLHGRGLNLWRQRKTGLRERVQALLARMQPDMFISAR